MEEDDRQIPPRHLYAQHLLGAAANLSGTCLAGAALIHIEQTQSGRELITDNILAVSALFFLLATGLAYVALRQRSTRITPRPKSPSAWAASCWRSGSSPWPWTYPGVSLVRGPSSPRQVFLAAR